jgi:hypothetical protein
MHNTFSGSACLCLTCKVSVCDAKELIISILKLSNRLPISALVAPPFVDFCTLEKVVSLVADLFLVDPQEHLL